MKKYLANYDDGHDYGSFEFYSDHRANSKANLEDAKNAAIQKYGYSRAAKIKITGTQIYNAY